MLIFMDILPSDANATSKAVILIKPYNVISTTELYLIVDIT